MLRRSALFVGLLAAVLSFGASAMDTDGDGFSDALENAFRTDPNDPASFPAIQGPVLPFGKLEMSIRLNFDQDSGRVRLGGRLPLPAGVTFANTRVIMSIGGIIRFFGLDTNGIAVVRDNVFVTIPGAETDGRFAAGFDISNLAMLADEGITNAPAKDLSVSVPITFYVGNVQYTSTLMGVYNASLNQKGKLIGELHLFSEPFTKKAPALPQPTTTLFDVTPNPAKVNEAVTFSATTTTKDSEGILGSILLFGDGSPILRQAGSLFANGATQQHTYTAERGYTARLIMIGANGLQLSKLFIVVGDKTALNGVSGLGSTLQQTGAQLQLAINTENVENASKVLTNFTDTFARAPLTATRSVDPESREEVEGEFPSRNNTASGITVADTTVQDSNGTTQAEVRKQVVVSDLDVGASDALPAPVTTDISVVKMTGKFLFSKTTSNDQVTLSGQITLPTGFQPARTDGNSFVVGLGNVVDTVVIDLHGRPLDPKNGTLGRIKRVKITYPHLPKGQTATVGGEIAKISVTLSIPDLDVAGFDTEGITATLRDDEADMPAVDRYIQVGMVLAGVGFQSLITVDYKVTSTGDTGSFKSRKAD